MVDLVPDSRQVNITGREPGSSVGMAFAPAARGLDVLARAEAAPGKVRTRAKGHRAIGVERQHHPVRRAMEGVPNLQDRERVESFESDIERFFDGTTASLRHGPRVVPGPGMGWSGAVVGGHIASKVGAYIRRFC